jgi:hypothetical protein
VDADENEDEQRGETEGQSTTVVHFWDLYSTSSFDSTACRFLALALTGSAVEDSLNRCGTPN